MTLTDLINRVWLKLDENTLFYPAAEVVLSGINPAMRLIAYVRPLTQRTLMTFAPETLVRDLRLDLPRCWQIQRVVLGDATGDTAGGSAQTYRHLEPTTMLRLQWRRDWLQLRGTPTHYWVWGDHWFGVYKRPRVTTSLTVVHAALPAPFAVTDLTLNPSPTPQLAVSQHPLIADVATGLLLFKESAAQIERAQVLLGQVLSREQLAGVRKLVRQIAGVPGVVA